MTQTKVTKTIAILLAMAVAFALASVTFMNSAKAATSFGGNGYSFEIQSPVVAKASDKDFWFDASTASYENGEVPLITVSIKYANADGKMAEKKLEESIRFFQTYKDGKLDTEFALKPENFVNVKQSAEELTFTIDLKDFSGLLYRGVNYIKFDKAVTATEGYEGDEVVITLTLPGTKGVTPTDDKSTTKSTTSTTRKTYSYSYRTISTRTTLRTVSTTNRRVNPANTDDPSHMPLWVSLAILAAGAGAMTYVWKQRDE